jgi:SMI1/KNR4 family protein SUKH-1
VRALTEAELANFWNESDDYFTSSATVTHDLIQAAEAQLGYKLPEDYVRLLKIRNGGAPKRTCFPTNVPTSWAKDHVAVSGVCGLGGQWGIDSPTLGSRHMIDEWGYPDIGIVFGQCPSAGHDALMLDYSVCGPAAEPRVIHVDVETVHGPDITIVAPDLAMFVRGLVDEAQFDTSAEDLERDLEHVCTGRFSSKLDEIVNGPEAPANTERALRALCAAVTRSKGHFSLHADDQSVLVYDTLFLLYTRRHGSIPRDTYLAAYPELLVFGDGEFSTGGYAPAFVEDWFDSRVRAEHIRAVTGGFEFADLFATKVEAALLEYA